MVYPVRRLLCTNQTVCLYCIVYLVFTDTLASTVKIEVLKETYSALFCFLVECVRKNVEMDSLSSYLESVRFSQDKIDKILSLYVDNKDTIHRKLLYYGIKPCHLTNVSWKMNFCVKVLY